MEMDQVEQIRRLEDLVDHDQVPGQPVRMGRVQAQSLLHDRHQTIGLRPGIAAGIEGYVVAQRDQGIGQMGDHALGPAIGLGRYAFEQGRDLRNLHSPPPSGTTVAPSNARA
jgi:hypothetical protein